MAVLANFDLYDYFLIQLKDLFVALKWVGIDPLEQTNDRNPGTYSSSPQFCLVTAHFVFSNSRISLDLKC